jgi:hypothetical protein
MTKGLRGPLQCDPFEEGRDYFFAVFFPPAAFFGSFFVSPFV